MEELKREKLEIDTECIRLASQSLHLGNMIKSKEDAIAKEARDEQNRIKNETKKARAAQAREADITVHITLLNPAGVIDITLPKNSTVADLREMTAPYQADYDNLTLKTKKEEFRQKFILIHNGVIYNTKNTRPTLGKALNWQGGEQLLGYSIEEFNRLPVAQPKAKASAGGSNAEQTEQTEQ